MTSTRSRSRAHIRKSCGCVEMLRARPVYLDCQKRVGRAAELKRAIATRAIEYVQSGDHLFLDASTTCYYLAEALAQAAAAGSLCDVTIMTHSVPMLAMCCRRDLPLTFMGTGGQLDAEWSAVLGHLTVDALSRRHFAKGFVSGAGFSIEAGLTTTNDKILGLIKAVLPLSRKAYCLVDSTKLGRDCLLHSVSLQAFDMVLTNDAVGDAARQSMLDAGIRAVFAAAASAGTTT